MLCSLYRYSVHFSPERHVGRVAQPIQSPVVRRKHKFLLALVKTTLLLQFAIVAVTSFAQNQIIQVTRWRMQAGDDPACAQPNFDDSQWPTIDYWKMNAYGIPGGTRWYRAIFEVPADFKGQEIAVGMGPLEEVYEVYIDGTLVGRFGTWRPTPRGPFPTHLVFPIPPGVLDGPVGHIAIRQWRGASGVFWLTFTSAGISGFSHPPQIGLKAAIEPREQLHLMAGAIANLPWDLTDVLLLIAATVCFALFSVQRRKAEFLYLGIYCLLWGGSYLVAIPVVLNQSVMARSWGPILLVVLQRSANVFSLLFLAELCPRIRRILQFGAVILSFWAIALGFSFAVEFNTQALLHGDDWSLAIFALIAAGALVLDRSFGSSAIAFCLLLNAAGWFFPIAFYPGPFLIDLRSLPPVLFVFVTLLVVYLRYRDEQIRHATLDLELAAARKMQEELLTAGVAVSASFTVDAVYRPAREVGGDFYRTVPFEDDSLLVILGDVSGKGFDAALLVAVVLGSLASETHRNPASLLEHLNRSVMGRTAGGFVTACCARFYPDGRVILANAGHLSPYIEGRELQLENGLPLGISGQATYDETEVLTGKPVTFLSDGVVEARNAKGELFGFERMAPLTTKPAAKIADAAQRWGQEDDITVLTVVATLAPI